MKYSADLNLLTRGSVETSDSKRIISAAVLGVVAIAIVAGVVLPNMMEKNKKDDLEALKQKQVPYLEILAEYDDAETALGNITTLQNEVDKFGSERVNSTVLALLLKYNRATAAPGEAVTVRFTDISLRDNVVDIRGLADSTAELSSLAKAIQDTERFLRVSITASETYEEEIPIGTVDPNDPDAVQEYRNVVSVMFSISITYSPYSIMEKDK